MPGNAGRSGGSVDPLELGHADLPETTDEIIQVGTTSSETYVVYGNKLLAATDKTGFLSAIECQD